MTYYDELGNPTYEITKYSDLQSSKIWNILKTDQGHTVTLLRGHQDMERMSPQQEMVTVVVEVEALIQVLTINSFMMNKTSILKMLP